MCSVVSASPAKSQHEAESIIDGNNGSEASTRTFTSAPTVTTLGGAKASVTSIVAVGSAKPGFFFCGKCKLEKPCTELSSRPNTCTLDNASYKAIAQKWKSQRSLKVWWDKMSDEDKVAWFRKKQEAPPGTKRTFDEVTYAEQSVDAMRDTEREAEHFETYDVFFERQLLRGNTPQWIEAKWKEEIEAPDSEAIFRRNQWLLPRFTGVYRYQDVEHTEQMCVDRSARVTSSEQLRALQTNGRQLMQQYRATQQPTQMRRIEAPFVDANVAEQPVRPEPMPAIANQVHREANAIVRAEALQRQNDNDDLLQAAAAVGEQGPSVRRETSVALTRIRVSGRVIELTQKLDEAMTKSESELVSCREHVGKLPENLRQGFHKGMDDLEVEFAEVKARALHLTESLKNISNQVGLADENAALSVHRKRSEQEYKDFMKEKLNTYASHHRALKKAIDAAVRQSRLVESNAAPKVQHMAHPLVTILRLVEANIQLQPSRSVYEAKGGLRLALAEPTDSDLKDFLESIPKVKKAEKNMGTHLLTHSNGVETISDKPTERKIFKKLKENFEACLLQSRLCPQIRSGQTRFILSSTTASTLSRSSETSLTCASWNAVSCCQDRCSSLASLSTKSQATLLRRNGRLFSRVTMTR
eukprot:TRINITY_DN9190_c0_g1_i1.p1 TRINITY_DN9190_c0_g1~~TRINITY_DN9190_c0_g1_i1.p1  ORF type:complete len:706 (+),score=107.13 TRINITY_DN9190_c0_g1_i1:195-2120(+)